MRFPAPEGSAAARPWRQPRPRAKAVPLRPEPWIDLSTGINPHSFPLWLPATALTRLPEPARVRGLMRPPPRPMARLTRTTSCRRRARRFFCPTSFRWSARPRRILGPTYAEHAARRARRSRAIETGISMRSPTPISRWWSTRTTRTGGLCPTRPAPLAEVVRRKGGLLVVDEAFMDVGPRERRFAAMWARTASSSCAPSANSSDWPACALVRHRVATDCAVARAGFGPWSVSWPALEYGGLTALGTPL